MPLKQPPNNKEQGAILFISPIMLLLITMVAISSTLLSTTGQRVSLTYQLQNSTFQAADSELGTKTEEILNANPAPQPSQVDTTYSNNNDITISVTTITTRELISGNSIGVGKGLPQTFRYTTNSTSRATGHNVVTELEQVSQIRTLAE